MRSAVKLKEAVPARSLERQALGAAIERRDAAVVRVGKVHEAAERAQRLSWSASNAAEDAREALKAARDSDDDGGDIIDQLLSGGDVALVQLSTDVAECAVAEAEKKQRQIDKTRELLQRERARAENELEQSREAVMRAVASVMAAEVPVDELLALARAMQADLIALRVQLRELYNGDLLDGAVQEDVRAFLFDIHVLPTCRGQTEWQVFDAHPAAGLLRDAVTRLADDADAVLPDLLGEATP